MREDEYEDEYEEEEYELEDAEEPDPLELDDPCTIDPVLDPRCYDEDEDEEEL